MVECVLSVEELSQCYRHDDVVVIDCRFSLADPDAGQALYQSGHIAGAHYLHLERDLSAKKSRHGGRHPLPSTTSIATTLAKIGVNRHSLVVAYDDSGFAFASRLWWLLRYLGHDQVKVLDGGYKAWCAAALATDKDIPVVSDRGDFKAQPRENMAIDINEVKTIPHQQNAALIDSRERERFLGINEPIDPVAGHINGAVNFPWQEVSDEQGFFKAPELQQQRWGELAQREQLVVYCGSGVTACVNLLALAAIGRDDARLYAGSWSDWCSYL